MNERQIELFEQPITGDTAILTCGHRVALGWSWQARRRNDGWYAAIYCPDCGRQREVERVVYPKEPRGT